MPEQPLNASPAMGATIFARLTVEPGFNRRIVRFLGLFGFVALVTGAAMLLSYRLLDTSSIGVGDGVDVQAIFIRLYAGALVLIAIGVWWIVLTHESRELSERELLHSLHNLEMTREELVQSEKLASLGGLVAGVAHEINTPVGITVSAASFLADKTKAIRQRVGEGTLQPSHLSAYLADAEESARLLLSNANRAADIIQSFKQVAVDRTSDEQREFNLRESLYEIVQSLQPRLKRTACRVTVECPANIRVHSYPGPLGQVLSNLIMNSLHHAYGPGESGHIRISAQSESDNMIQIRCADSGVGIPAEHLAKIFEPFFTTKRGEGGSGLGLYVVYNIVTAKLGGSIRVQSTQGKGTTFVLRLPRRLAARTTETERLPPQYGGHADA